MERVPLVTSNDPLWVQEAIKGIEVVIEELPEECCITVAEDATVYYFVRVKQMLEVLHAKSPEAVRWLRRHGVKSSSYFALPGHKCEFADEHSFAC